MLRDLSELSYYCNSLQNMPTVICAQTQQLPHSTNLIYNAALLCIETRRWKIIQLILFTPPTQNVWSSLFFVSYIEKTVYFFFQYYTVIYRG